MVAQGMSNGQIAQDLYLSERTIEHHVSKILRKLGDRTNVAFVGHELRIAAPSDHCRPTGAIDSSLRDAIKGASLTIFTSSQRDSEGSMSDDSFEKRIREVIIGEIEQPTIVIADYNPEWPELFRQEEVRIVAALGEAALSVEHIGSTSVPGLAAKPILDILLVVENSGEEATYLPAMEEAGYVLRVREPDFDEHRMFRTPAKDVHVHVFSAGSPEIERYLLLRDRLRQNEGERELYAQTKRELAKRDWTNTEHYAEAKTEVVEGIICRAAAARSSHDGVR
jgi:GrpB-like predicted nucleotidyltransferase (UPF0157 family)